MNLIIVHPVLPLDIYLTIYAVINLGNFKILLILL